MKGTVVEVAAKHFTVPFECTCCGAAPDSELEVAIARGRDVAPQSARALWFPYCQRCVAHAGAWESAGVGKSGVVVAAIISGIVISFTVKLVVGLLVWIGAIPIALKLGAARRARAKAGCGPACASPGIALQYFGWSGAVSAFSFESPTYAARFAEQNEKLVVTNPALQKLLERHRIARFAVPTPAIAAPLVPPALDAAAWIARIEATTTRVACREILVRGLAAMHDPVDQHQLVDAAARIEIAAILEDVARASSAALQRSRLQRAIVGARADNLPEPLQHAVLRDLEGRLAQVGGQQDG